MDRKKRLDELAAAFSECQQALFAIGDPTRQLIILALIEGSGESNQGSRVGEIASRTNLSRPAVSHHMKILKDAHFICMRRVGTRNYYYLEVLHSDLFKLKQLFEDSAAFVHQLQASSTPVMKEEG
ncbi:winged helix-turn-helix transcriptional regulator [Paenibacillus tritici]|uniref:ArsR/SmtB family transcription factor n=1 Tax=Paenibacillus tritici TaxID=1873425 RepID=UPI001BA8B6A0|nr:metalloregulator ArsR/SmtB family transcription factor [Paenibacillus tritici]QUL58025.1 winged helix-turn-helix transcriptional regulator [Paenibacillus tritici]